MSTFLSVNTLIISLFGVSSLTLVWQISLALLKIKRASTHKQNQKKEQLSLRLSHFETALLSLLQYHLFQTCSEILQNNIMNTEQIQSIDLLYQSYKKLGGNGTADILYQKIKQVEIKKNKAL